MCSRIRCSGDLHRGKPRPPQRLLHRSLNAIFRVYLGESFPLRVRPKAIALGSATSLFSFVTLTRSGPLIFLILDWIWNFLLSFFAPRIANDIGPLILMIFFGMLVFGFIYVYLFIPETKGLSLEEVLVTLNVVSPTRSDPNSFRRLMRCTAPGSRHGTRPSGVQLRSISMIKTMRRSIQKAPRRQKQSLREQLLIR